MIDSEVHNLLVGSWDLSTALWFGKATRSDKTFWGAAVADCNTGGNSGIYFPNDANRADARVTSGAEYVLSFFARADVAGDRIHSNVWGSKYMLDTTLTTEWRQVVMPYGIVNADHREIFIYGLRTNSGTVHVALPMANRGTEPAAWAPAEGETLAGGGAQMSANLLAEGDRRDGSDGTTYADGVWSIPANGTSKDKNAVYDWPTGTEAVTENQTLHVGLSVRAASGASVVVAPGVAYVDGAGNVNYVVTRVSARGTGAWQRVEGSFVMPSGMRVSFLFVHQGAGGAALELTAPCLSYGSPVCLASSAHTPYATQDHVAAEYATKAALKVTSDAVTAEVTERGRLAGRVGTLESTTGTHASRLEQLAASIKSLVKGESTYTDPDGASATSGIYSLVTQTRDSVTALFGQYTKTADLASTQAVKDAKKAGTDAQAAASAAQSTADSLATLIRADSTGITVGKSTDGKTYTTGRTRMTDSAFEVLDKAGKVLASFGGNVVSLLGGILTIAAGQGGVGSIYTADGNSLFLKSGKDAEVSDNRGSYIEVNDVFASLNSKPAGGTMNSLMVNNDGIFAQTQGASGLMLGPVHSMYNQYNGQHVYTGKASEISDLKSIGWTDEGVKFYAFLGIDNR